MSACHLKSMVKRMTLTMRYLFHSVYEALNETGIENEGVLK